MTSSFRPTPSEAVATTETYTTSGRHARAPAVLPVLPAVAAHTRPAWAMPERLIRQFMTDARVHTHAAGAMVVHAGAPADTVYLILDGTVRGFVTGQGDRQLVLGDLGPGEYFGETVINGGTRCTSGVAVTDARVASITRDAFLSALANDHDFALHLMRKFSLRVRAMTEFVRRLALADARERVLLFLREMALAHGDVHAPLSISQQAIGNRFGTTRSMVNRVLKALAQEGIISVSPAGVALRRMPARLPNDRARAALPAHDSNGRIAARGLGVVNAHVLAPSPTRLTPPLPANLIAVVRARGHAAQYVPGTVINREGAPAESFCLITRGRLLVSLTGDAGRVFHLGEISEGEYFGENTVVPHGVWGARISAIERCEIVHLSCDAMLSLLHERPDFTQHVLTKLSQRLRTLTHQVKCLALQDVVDRTRALLLDLAAPASAGPRMLPGGLSQQAISERVGASRSMINRVMRDLLAEGFVQMLDGRLALRSAGHTTATVTTTARA